MKDGFPVYGKDDLGKVNAMREAKTQPEFYGIPIISDGSVLYVKASEIGNKPASCYTCQFKNRQPGTCQRLGPAIIVNKLQKKGIEYWPCCGGHKYGEPDGTKYLEPFEKPDALGLVWINAPYAGADYGGASCGGRNAGDDCDHYQITEGDKRSSKQGFCRVLRHSVDNGDVCSAWHDDDELPWREAQQILQPDADKKKLASEIIGKDK